MLARYKKNAVVIALSCATALTGLAYAQVHSPEDGTRLSQSHSTQMVQNDQNAQPRATPDWLNLGQIYAKLEASGYADIREIERKRDGYEAKARDPDGRSVKLYVEPTEGRIVDKKLRSRDGKRDRDRRDDRY